MATMTLAVRYTRAALARVLPALLLGAAAALAHAADAAQQARALFDEYWEHTASDHPEWATWRGDHRFDDRLTDATPAARAERDAR